LGQFALPVGALVRCAAYNSAYKRGLRLSVEVPMKRHTTSVGPEGHSLPHAQLDPSDDFYNPIELRQVCDTTSVFDPRLFLANLPFGRTTREYARGEVIFSQGAIAGAVFWVLHGEVKLAVVSPEGKEAVIAILSHGNFFGEGCLAGQPLYSATAIAIHPSTVIRVPLPAMTSLLHHEPRFAEGFIAHLLARHIRMEQDLLDQLFHTSEKRLARLLLLMARSSDLGESLPVVERLSHQTLAEMIGTTRSRVTFFMNRFRKLGFIDYDGGMHVHSSLRVVLHE
jgi:CRP/FNR family cyclic AMP-dependent transcriptional regulator